MNHAEIKVASVWPMPITRFQVLFLCTAYESGVGHGQQNDNLCNPYADGDPAHYAYELGLEQGRKARKP